jgi:hypothetical protein
VNAQKYSVDELLNDSLRKTDLHSSVYQILREERLAVTVRSQARGDKRGCQLEGQGTGRVVGLL